LERSIQGREKRFEGGVPGAVLARTYGIGSRVFRNPVYCRPSGMDSIFPFKTAHGHLDISALSVLARGWPRHRDKKTSGMFSDARCIMYNGKQEGAARVYRALRQLIIDGLQIPESSRFQLNSCQVFDIHVSQEGFMKIKIRK
jgi:hypothetical protein